MRRKHMAWLILAAVVYTAVPSVNPVADAGITAEAHGGHRGGHGCHERTRESHYHCNGHEAHDHVDGRCPYWTEEAVHRDSTPCYEACEWEHVDSHC